MRSHRVHWGQNSNSLNLLPYFLITWCLNIQAKISYRNYVQQSKLIVLFVDFCSVFLYEHVPANLRQTKTAVTLNKISLLPFVADKTEAKSVYKSERSAINQVEVKFFHLTMFSSWLFEYENFKHTTQRWAHFKLNSELNQLEIMSWSGMYKLRRANIHEPTLIFFTNFCNFKIWCLVW